MVFTSQNAKDQTNQDKTLQTTSSGAHMTMEDTEQKMAAFLVKKLLTLEESKTLSVSTVMSMKLLELEPTALALKLITNAI
jgi:hypothetical protein